MQRPCGRCAASLQCGAALSYDKAKNTLVIEFITDEMKTISSVMKLISSVMKTISSVFYTAKSHILLNTQKFEKEAGRQICVAYFPAENNADSIFSLFILIIWRGED
jgi:hypothetical protein